MLEGSGSTGGGGGGGGGRGGCRGRLRRIGRGGWRWFGRSLGLV